MNNKTTAPIVLFVYNRPWHTKQTIEALQKNELAKESELFIYSDAPKNDQAREAVDQVRIYLKTIEGFKSITIIERETNWGLAKSIIDGVSTVVNQYGKVIVLEDDLVTSPYFLKFMNDVLEFYKDEKKVWHVSGWNYPIEDDNGQDVFLWRVMNCWGWATWADRWQYYEKDVNKLIKEFSKEDIYRFNVDGTENFWAQVQANQKGTIDTWAIFWYATIFKHNGLCLNPIRSYVHNIGFDGSGVHCGVGDDGTFGVLNRSDHVQFTKEIIENAYIVEKIKSYFKKRKRPIYIRAFKKLFRKLLEKKVYK